MTQNEKQRLIALIAAPVFLSIMTGWLIVTEDIPLGPTLLLLGTIVVSVIVVIWQWHSLRAHTPEQRHQARVKMRSIFQISFEMLAAIFFISAAVFLFFSAEGDLSNYRNRTIRFLFNLFGYEGIAALFLISGVMCLIIGIKDIKKYRATRLE